MENVAHFKAAIAAIIAILTALWGWFGWLVVLFIFCCRERLLQPLRHRRAERDGILDDAAELRKGVPHNYHRAQQHSVLKRQRNAGDVSDQRADQQIGDACDNDHDDAAALVPNAVSGGRG